MPGLLVSYLREQADAAMGVWTQHFSNIYCCILSQVKQDLRTIEKNSRSGGTVMGNDDTKPWLKGVREGAQGIRDFYRFSSYLTGWIKPHLLADLETIFEGARTYWDNRRMPEGSGGRGDFVMAAALLAAFDHLGSFITTSEKDWITPSNNVIRVAECLPSLKDISALIATMARNALIHVGWPQTAVPMDQYSWAFGLTFSANSDLRRHDNLYTDHWLPDGPTGARRRALKLKLNVHVVRLQFEEWIYNGNLAAKVDDRAFMRIRDLSMQAGNPHGAAKDRYDTLVHGSRVVTPNFGESSWRMLCRQVKALRAESERIGCWQRGGFREPIARDFGGQHPPGPAELERKKSIEKMLLVRTTDVLRARSTLLQAPTQ